eukprot:4255073-Amphidinium_carterae.3
MEDGFTAPQADMVVRFLAERPTLLAVCGLPAGLLSVLRVWGHASWWTINGTDACSSALGVRQGDCLSAMVFDIFYSHVMDILQQRLRDAGVLTELVAPQGRSFYPDPSGRSVLAGPIAYRDDMSISLQADTNAELLSKAILVSNIVCSVHCEYQLEVNLAPKKTELTVRHVRPDAKSVFQGMRAVGRARGVNGPALALHNGGTLVVAKEYGHLGCVFAQDLNLRGETSQMIARSRSAIKEKKLVLQSGRLTIPSRITLYTTYARGHLLQNVAVLQPLHHKLLDRLRAEYIRGLRVATGQQRTAVKHDTIPTAELLSTHKLATLEVLME